MPSQHWTARIAYFFILAMNPLLSMTHWGHKPQVRHVFLGLMFVALSVLLWDWWQKRNATQGT